MNKIFSCIIILFLSSTIKAQELTQEQKSKEESITMFDYGEPLQTTEASFKNLFKNFPLFVTNYSEGLKLLSYEFVTSITTEKQIKSYLEKNKEVYLCGGSIVSALGGNSVETNMIRLSFPSEGSANKVVDKVLSEETAKEFIKIEEHINVGDEVYLVKFIANGKKYDFYMFADPKTKTVIKKGNFLAFSIPLYYAQYHSKKN